jgi:hypothetical protein
VVTITTLVIILIAIAGVAGALVLQPDDDGGGTARTTTTSTGSTTTSEPPPSEDADGNGRIDNPGPPPGHEEPPPATTAPEVASLNHAVHDGFERVSIRFTGDLPPTAALVRDPDRGLLRLDFPEVDPTGAEDGDAMAQVFGADSELGLSAFFVLDRDGNAFVDIHADTPVTAEHFRLIIEDGDRPVIAIDLREDVSGGMWNPSQVDVAGGVILEPVPNASLVGTTSLYVEGYGRRDDSAGVVEVIDSTGVVVGSTDVAVPAAGRANGFFGAEVFFAEPLAPGTHTIRFRGTAPDGSPAAVDTTVGVE